MDDRRCLVWCNTRASRRVSYSDKLTIWTHLQASSTIAKHIAEAAPANKAILIDCFAGVGGNVIAFAQSERWKRVYAIEKDPRALACAKHNAEIYGVRDRISWYEGDCFEILRNELAELGQHSVFYASPPWGGKSTMLRWVRYAVTLKISGPGYRTDTIFNLAKMQPYTLTDLLHPFQKLTEDVVLYLPRTSDIRQLAHISREGSKMTVMHYCVEGASKVGRTLWSNTSDINQTTGDMRVLWCFCLSLIMQGGFEMRRASGHGRYWWAEAQLRVEQGLAHLEAGKKDELCKRRRLWSRAVYKILEKFGTLLWASLAWLGSALKS